MLQSCWWKSQIFEKISKFLLSYQLICSAKWKMWHMFGHLSDMRIGSIRFLGMLQKFTFSHKKFFLKIIEIVDDSIFQSFGISFGVSISWHKSNKKLIFWYSNLLFQSSWWKSHILLICSAKWWLLRKVCPQQIRVGRA